MKQDLLDDAKRVVDKAKADFIAGLQVRTITPEEEKLIGAALSYGFGEGIAWAIDNFRKRGGVRGAVAESGKTPGNS